MLASISRLELRARTPGAPVASWSGLDRADVIEVAVREQDRVERLDAKCVDRLEQARGLIPGSTITARSASGRRTK